MLRSTLKREKNSTHSKTTLTTIKTYDADERRARRVGDGLRHHGLARSRGPVHEDASGRIDADLLVQLKVRQRELHCLLDLFIMRRIKPRALAKNGGMGERGLATPGGAVLHSKISIIF